MSNSESMQFAPMRVVVRANSPAAASYVRSAGINPEAAVPQEAALFGAAPSTADDLIFHGGKTIQDLKFTNFYVAGDTAWDATDIQNIDQALSAAMSDVNLNNVMLQYYNGPITSQFLGSHNLPGDAPAVVSQGDAEQLVGMLFQQGAFDGMDLASTVVNLMLPSGTILTTDEATTSAKTLSPMAEPKRKRKHLDPAIPVEDQARSDLGLGGFHGSIHMTMSGLGVTIYYAIGAFSEMLANGTRNGIVAFDEPWKNVAGTFYHELNEARTDPDVEDAIRTRRSSFIGWTSRRGEEIGDSPIRNARNLSDVFQEVPLTDGSGTVPVQFMYSNAVHMAEGPSPVARQRANAAGV